jgi:hypothetical protein
MKNDRKKYTFEDWKSGKPINGRNGKVYNDIRLALLDTLAGFDDIIDDSEYSKIKKMQETAFNKACEINFYFNKKDLHRSIERVKEEALISPEEKLNDKVKEIEQYIESNQKLKESVSQGAKDYRFISYKKCLEVDEAYSRLESMQSKWIGFSIPTEGKKAKPSEKLLMKERLLMLKYINENREKILSNSDSEELLDEPSTKIGRPSEYNKQVAIDYFDDNKKELISLWYKTGGKTNVAKEILLKAYKGKKKPHPQTVADYIEDYLNTNSEK